MAVEYIDDGIDSRFTEIMNAMINGEEYDKPAQSRMEALLLELKEVIDEGSGGQWLIQEGDVTCSRSDTTRVYTSFRPEHIITYATDTADYSNRRVGGVCTTPYGSCDFGGIQNSNNSVNYGGITTIPNTADNNQCQQIFDDGFLMGKMTNQGLVYHWIAIAHKS